MSASTQYTSISPPTVEEEARDFEERVHELESWFRTPRFAAIKRPYTPASVVSKQGSQRPLPLPSAPVAHKLFNLLQEAGKEGRPLHTFGVIDPVQMTQMAERQEVVYISGWTCSSTLTSSNEVGPDLGDYPYTTVPNQVERIFRAQELHDRKHYDERMSTPVDKREKLKYIDYMRPIIADGDTGHGGLSAVMKLAKLFAESGVSGFHIEDQLHGGKKCGHQGGKVIVPTNTHVSRLVAARFQLDILQSPVLTIARTDSQSGRLLSSNVDPADHEFILGTITPGKGLAESLAEAERQGASGEQIDALEIEWMGNNKLVTFDQAVAQAIEASSVANKLSALEEYNSLARGGSNSEARAAARKVLGKDIFWDWDLPRTKEGFYHTSGGTETVIKRLLAFAPYADMLWYETNTPSVKESARIARIIREKFPGKQFVYNLSPSFNWGGHEFTDEKLKSFIWDVAREGYTFQLISLGGLHNTALSSAHLSASIQKDGMLGYVNEVQRKEREIGCDVLTHQKWSGASYIDRILTTVSSGNSSTAAGGKDSTEHSF
ncbi:isocitrate lyase and phosphorylmutase [Ramaria rubella]|nr:isocitrate lyase and phosphorylmutase [Ramaria rubella]